MDACEINGGIVFDSKVNFRREELETQELGGFHVGDHVKVDRGKTPKVGRIHRFCQGLVASADVERSIGKSRFLVMIPLFELEKINEPEE